MNKNLAYHVDLGVLRPLWLAQWVIQGAVDVDAVANTDVQGRVSPEARLRVKPENIVVKVV